MEWFEPALSGPILRAFVYVATIGCAGGIFFYLTFPNEAQTVRPLLRWQIIIGFVLLLIAEPLRYVLFQIEISGGDWQVAFSPELRAIYIETPQGIAAISRLLGGVVIVLSGLRLRLVGLIGALIMVGGYLLEGHSVSNEPRWILATFLGIHLLVLHWWIGSLLPLYGLIQTADKSTASAATLRFGQIAIILVPIMLVVGLAILGLLVGWDINPASEYQQGIALKVLLAAGVLGLAAINKMWLTPLLTSSPEKGARYLQRSLKFEIGLALSVLIATAWAITTAPGMQH